MATRYDQVVNAARPSKLLLEERDGPVLSIHDARQLLGIDARRRVAFEQQGCQEREQCAQAQRQGDARRPRIGAAATHESRSHRLSPPGSVGQMPTRGPGSLYLAV